MNHDTHESTRDPAGDHLQYLLTAYLFDNISPAGRAEVEAHLSACAGCRDELAALRATLGQVSEALKPEAVGSPYSFQARRLERVLQAARTRRAGWEWLRGRRSVLGLAAAAVVMVGLGLSLTPAFLSKSSRGAVSSARVRFTDMAPAGAPAGAAPPMLPPMPAGEPAALEKANQSADYSPSPPAHPGALSGVKSYSVSVEGRQPVANGLSHAASAAASRAESAGEAVDAPAAPVVIVDSVLAALDGKSEPEASKEWGGRPVELQVQAGQKLAAGASSQAPAVANAPGDSSSDYFAASLAGVPADEAGGGQNHGNVLDLRGLSVATTAGTTLNEAQRRQVVLEGLAKKEGLDDLVQAEARFGDSRESRGNETLATRLVQPGTTPPPASKPSAPAQELKQVADANDGESFELEDRILNRSDAGPPDLTRLAAPLAPQVHFDAPAPPKELFEASDLTLLGANLDPDAFRRLESRLTVAKEKKDAGAPDLWARTSEVKDNLATGLGFGTVELDRNVAFTLPPASPERSKSRQLEEIAANEEAGDLNGNLGGQGGEATLATRAGDTAVAQPPPPGADAAAQDWSTRLYSEAVLPRSGVDTWYGMRQALGERDATPALAQEQSGITPLDAGGEAKTTGIAAAAGDAEHRLRAFRYYRELDPALTPEVFFKKALRVPPPAVGDEGLGEARFRGRYGVNPFVDTSRDHFSTFGMDVDTASYTLARANLLAGKLPDAKTVRVEEFINHFREPVDADPNAVFTVRCEGGPSPFGEGLELLKVTIKARELLPNERKNAVLTFAVDTSGSMNIGNRLATARGALETLLGLLAPEDRVAIVAFGATPYLVVPHTPAREKDRLLGAVRSLAPSGGTNVEAGLDLAYRVADEVFDPKSINRVVLCSDGVANVGARGPEEILRKVEVFARRGLYLSAVGFGLGKYNDAMLETLANKGNGNYAYVDSQQGAAEVFHKTLPSMLQVLAQDAKIQVDFNPEVVGHYRLLGYENRDIADKDFRNDKVDAGEVGPGTTVTALYEIRRKPSKGGDLGRVFLRYRDTGTGRVDEVSYPLPPGVVATRLRDASDRFRFIACAAETAELLRGSYWARDGSFGAVLRVLESLSPETRAQGEWLDLAAVVRAAQAASLPQLSQIEANAEKK